MASKMVNNICQVIGNTPMLELEEGILVKCEFMNPSGSVKARLAHYMVERAEQEGLLKPGDTIVEATSGNTGNALAMVAAAKGYKMLVLTARGFSRERAAISRAYGAEVQFIGNFDLTTAVEKAKELGQQPGYWCPSQFDNPWNIEENQRWLAQEILEQLPEGTTIDAIVQGVGTGGTLIGVGERLRAQHNPKLQLWALEPAEATTIADGTFGCHLIEGISDGFVPALFSQHRDEVTGLVAIDSEKAVAMMHRLAKHHGLFVGPSSGANWLAARQLREQHPEIKTVLTFFCDKGEKYLEQHFIHE